MRSFDPRLKKEATVKKVVDVPTASSLNGATLLSRKEGTILIADAARGSVFRLKTRTAAVSEVITNESLMQANASATRAVGVNGITVPDGRLYFTNSSQESLNSMPINADGTTAGPAQTIANRVTGDDFALDAQATNAYVVVNAENELVRVRVPGGEETVVVAGPDDKVTLPDQQVRSLEGGWMIRKVCM
ncbi:MAG: hypothetical protein Q9179_006079 [Wetmoreana sp. 5 TL-2023]